jgi:CheY-like chemotaxis protein
VRSDLTLLSRILLNLVANAVHYTARGRVIVGCRRRGQTLRIQVWDSGPGIPEDQRHKIFGEFYRMPGQAGPGLGLGLAIVDRLSGLLDHPVDLVSVVGKGSCFAVTAPVVAAKAKTVYSPTFLEAASEGTRGKRVLVIDDDARALEALGGLLRSWGCSVVNVGSSGAAFAEVAEHPPNLIISDYHLAEEKTGIDLIERLRCEFNTKIPAFLISGDTTAGCRHRVSAGGYVLLHKPVDPMTLRATVDRFLKSPAEPDPRPSVSAAL